MNREMEKGRKQLGMYPGTANARLKKRLLFDFAKKLNFDICYRCGERIEDEFDLTIDHKVPWRHSKNPVELFFDIDNIAFSHYGCNSGNARQVTRLKPMARHGTLQRYRAGCRCNKCLKKRREIKSEQRARRRAQGFKAK